MNAARPQRLRYAFEPSMARGPSALLGYLGLQVHPRKSTRYATQAQDRLIVLAED